MSRGAASGWRGALRRRLPAAAWAAGYSRAAAAADLVAGVTLGLTLVPQSIAYAALANLPLQYGLYTAYVGTIVYALLGTVKEVSIGPTSLLALLTLHLCRGLPPEFMLLLTFLSGCLVLLMGLLRMGFLVDLISPSVTSGFTSGTAVIIVVSQLKGLLGLSFTAESPADNLRLIAAHWRSVRATDAALAAVCCTALLLLRKLKDLPVSPKRARLRRALWLVSIARNALVVLAASLAAYLLHDAHNPMFKLSGRVAAGVPRLSLPPFSATVGNSTVGFLGMVERLGSGLLMMPLVMVIANIAIAKAFSGGGRVDATQEMVALGLCNVAGALAHAMPACGAFTRSAVSHSSGVRTPAAGLYSGVITLLALIFLTDYFYFIPKACLSSVLICAVVFMIDVGTLRRLWARGERTELAVCGATLGAALALSVELAVLVGALASLAALLRRIMRPPVHVYTHKTELGSVCVVRPELCLCYLNAEVVSRRVQAAADSAAADPGAGADSADPGGGGGGAVTVLVDCSALPLVDYSAQQVLERLIKKMKSSNQTLLFFHAGEATARALAGVAGVDARPLRAAGADAALLAAAGADIILDADFADSRPAPPAETVALLDKTPEQRKASV